MKVLRKIQFMIGEANQKIAWNMKKTTKRVTQCGLINCAMIFFPPPRVLHK